MESLFTQLYDVYVMYKFKVSKLTLMTGFVVYGHI